MPYVSKAERQAQQEQAKWVSLSELVEIVQAESNCSIEAAREQIRNALAEGAIWPLRWEPAPPESAYYYPRREGRVRLPTLSELMGLGEPGCPPLSRGGNHWVDYRSVSHWQAVEIDWEQGLVLDNFERDAFPRLRDDYRSADSAPHPPPRPRKAAWRTLWLDREACARHWPPVPHVISPTPPTTSDAAAIIRDVQCLQTEGLSNKAAAARGRVMPKYPLVSDLLNALRSEGGDIYPIGLLEKIIVDEWNNGNIKFLIHQMNVTTPEILEPIHRELTLHRTPSGERLFRCSIGSRNERGLLVTEFENPYVSDKDARYVMEKARAAGLVFAEQSNDTEIQPSQPDGAAVSIPSEVLSEATAAGTVSLDELKRFVYGSEHRSESALWNAAKDAFPTKYVPRQKLRDAIGAVRGRPGPVGRPKKSP